MSSQRFIKKYTLNQKFIIKLKPSQKFIKKYTLSRKLMTRLT